MPTKTTTRKTGTRARAPITSVAKKIEFCLPNVKADSVLLAGDFTAWQESAVALKQGKSGDWSAKLPLAPGRYEYRYIVDGEWVDDPAAPARVENPFGTSNALLVVE